MSGFIDESEATVRVTKGEEAFAGGGGEEIAEVRCAI